MNVESLLAGAVGPEHVLAAGRGWPTTAMTRPSGCGRQAASWSSPAAPPRWPGCCASPGAGMAVTARGSGTGLSGGADPRPGGIVVSFERMDAILEIDTANHVAVVEAGRHAVARWTPASRPTAWSTRCTPGSMSASLGGNVATNAGGMRAVKYGVTRHHVLGLEAVLGTGEVIRTGGKLVKVSSGYDLTQLILGSEGTLALVTEAIAPSWYPRPAPGQPCWLRSATLGRGDCRRCRRSWPAGGAADPRVHRQAHDGRDRRRRRARARDPGDDPGEGARLSGHRAGEQPCRSAATRTSTSRRPSCSPSWARWTSTCSPADAARRLIEAREKAFWAAKASGGGRHRRRSGAPSVDRRRSCARSRELALAAGGRLVTAAAMSVTATCTSRYSAGCRTRGQKLLTDIFVAAMGLGGAVSGEHGIGTARGASSWSWRTRSRSR